MRFTAASWLIILASGLSPWADMVEAAKPLPLSWGKPGVSLDDYVADAGQCGRAGYYLDVSHTDAAHVFQEATARLDTNESDLATPIVTPDDVYRKADIANRSQHIVDATRPEARFNEVRSVMQDAVDRCLVKLGYERFQLTASQAHHLRSLRTGSAERRAYLHSLASDAAILAAQKKDPMLNTRD